MHGCGDLSTALIGAIGPGFWLASHAHGRRSHAKPLLNAVGQVLPVWGVQLVRLPPNMASTSHTSCTSACILGLRLTGPRAWSALGHAKASSDTEQRQLP